LRRVCGICLGRKSSRHQHTPLVMVAKRVPLALQRAAYVTAPLQHQSPGRFKPYRKGMSTAAGMVYMKCDRFEMRHENRRFLLDQLKALLAEARKAGTAEDPLAATADFVQHKAGYEAVVEQHTSALVGALLKLTPEQIEHILATEPEVAKKVLPSLQDLLPHHLRGVSAS
jgi:hypothetical protein